MLPVTGIELLKVFSMNAAKAAVQEELQVRRNGYST